MSVWAVVPAAGAGSRMSDAETPVGLPKQYLTLANKTLLEHTLLRLDALGDLEAIVLVLHENDSRWPTLSPDLTHPVITVNGGQERMHSVYNGLCALSDQAADEDWVLVHDAARPCVRTEDIEKLMQALSDSDTGGLLAMPVNDTLKQVDANKQVTATLDRSGLWRAATPQVFRLSVLREALAEAIAGNVVVTDEAQAMERAGHAVTVVACSSDNIKVTYPEDLMIAEKILSMQQGNS